MAANNDTLVCHLTKCTPNSMVASARIANYIAAQLQAPLVDDEETAAHWQPHLPGLRLFVLVNSPTGFAPEAVRRFSAEALYHARHAVFANNDYKIKPPSQSKTHMRRVWGTHKGESSDYYGYSLWTTVPAAMRMVKRPLDSYVNWNQLTYSPQPEAESHTNRATGLLYWGALRLGREAELRRYLATDKFTVVISTAPQSVAKFTEHVPQAHYISQLKPLLPSLLHYRATLYTQDDYSDRVYCSPANRFYEALGAGLAIFIAHNSRNTFEAAKLPGYEEFVVRSADDISRLLPHAEQIARKQRALWDNNYQTLLQQQLKEAHAKTI